MKSKLGTKEITALRNELQDLLESAYAALGGDPDEEEKS